jgi:hypothetical protein
LTFFEICNSSATIFTSILVFKMDKELPVIPRLNLAPALGQEVWTASSLLLMHPPSDLVPRPPAASLKTNHVPSIRQSNTALAPQITPSMISRNASSGELPYKKILRGRLGVRTPRGMQCAPSNPSEPPGSQTFRSTMEVLNGRCGSFSSRTSKSASSSEMNHISDSATSWYERRSQVLSTFSAPLFGFCSSPANNQTGATRQANSNVRLRPQSSGQALIQPWTGVTVECSRPTTSSYFLQNSASTRLDDESLRIENRKLLNYSSQAPSHQAPIHEDGSSLGNPESRASVSATATQISIVTQVASKFTEKIRPQSESCFLFPSQGITSPSLGQLSNNTRSAVPTLEQAMAELTKGQPLKKFSHSSQRVAVKIFRLNSNAELLVDDELQERVVAIFDGLSPYISPKQNVPSEDDFVPKFVSSHVPIVCIINNPSIGTLTILPLPFTSFS